MIRNFCSLAITALLLFAVHSHAAEDGLVLYDLSLAGYRIGMTYDEATSVRPFHYVQDLKKARDGKPYFAAVIDPIHVDGTEMRLLVEFFEDKAHKVICKVHPSAVEEMVRRLHLSLGQSENKSKVIANKGGGEIRQTVYEWGFPNAKMILYGSSANSEFAIVSLVGKKEANPGVQDK